MKQMSNLRIEKRTKKQIGILQDHSRIRIRTSRQNPTIGHALVPDTGYLHTINTDE